MSNSRFHRYYADFGSCGGKVVVEYVFHIKNLYVCQCSVVVCSNTDKMSLSVGAATGSNIWSMIVPLPKRNLRRFVRGKFDVFFVI